MSEEEKINVLEEQPCPMCHKKSLTLREMDRDIPFFGMCYVFSMDCNACNYHMADVEVDEAKGQVKYSFDVATE